MDVDALQPGRGRADVRQPATETLRAVVPMAAAVGVFGLVYGAAAQPVLGTPLTIVSSLLVFSGAAQFALIALLAAGASPAAVLWAVAVLAVRHLALGALVRPGLSAHGAARRAGLAWFLVDESAGLALLAPDVGRTLLRAGAACYLAWVAGTAMGLAGADLPGLEALAAAVFPVLFVGLAALTAGGRAGAARALAGAMAVVVLLVVWPVLGGLAPVLAAVAVALPGAGR